MVPVAIPLHNKTIVSSLKELKAWVKDADREMYIQYMDREIQGYSGIISWIE